MLASSSSSYIALLRGINLGGRNKLPMSGLSRLFSECGCTDVRTYIQSGNVLFRASASCAANLVGVMPEKIESRFGFAAPVVLRKADELHAAIERNPFRKRGIDESSLHVAFLADAPDKSRIARLDFDRSPGDSFALVMREVYLHLPNGVARSKLTNAYFDSILQTVSTIRNWRTVVKLDEMLRAATV